MALPAQALAQSNGSAEVDLPRLAADRLRAALHQRHDGAVLADLLEEDLRSALESLESLRAHLEDVFSAVLAERPAPLDLLEAGEDAHAQQALLQLEEVLSGLKRRLGQAACRVAATPRK